MPVEREKVVVAMSGGVDSATAACLLVEQGFDVTGLFMRVGVEDAAAAPSSCPPSGHNDDRVGSAPRHQGCCSASDAADARFVAGMLGIPFYALNFRKEFEGIIDYFADEYIGGRTPNPCVRCNDQLKFGRLLEYADTVGAKYIATGHYARVGYRVGASVAVAECGEVPAATSGRHCRVLMRAYDKQKDQSYVLFGLNRGVLDRVMFPIGGYSKSDVRALAAGFGLPNHDKPDSVEICFVPDGDYARMLRQRRPEAFSTGDVVASTGRVIGQHKGVGCYTIGQRRGLGIAAGTPMYVTHLDALHNTVTVGGADELLSCTLMADGVNYLVDPPDSPFRAQVKIRYMHEAAEATVHRLDGGRWRVIFDQAQRAITPGQAVVCYDGDVVIGGGWIDRADAP